MAFLTVCLNPTIQKTLRYPSIISGTVNRTALHRLDVSGKGVNVTRVLTQLGKNVLHLTQLGGVMKLLFLSLCENDGLCVEWAESGSEIRFCYTLLTDAAVTELVEESQPVAAGTEKHLIEKFDMLLEKDNYFDYSAPVIPHSSFYNPHCLIISGTKAAGFSDNIFPTMTRKAKEKGLCIILDVKGNDLINCLEYEPDIIKPNLYEFAATFAPQLIKDNDLVINDNNKNIIKETIESKIMDITQKYKCRVILTNGSKKIITADKNNVIEIDVPAVKAVNTIGCGDAFTAGLAAALSGGADIIAAINEGNRCGALNAGLEKPGVIR
ncbi:MAG: PfkB family carbohydrate kinase [Treponema sp.]|nr:PfkB family carbohydrate kinase [Treponema sp.]